MHLLVFSYWLLYYLANYKDIQIIFDKYAQDKEEFTREMFNVNARVTEVNAYFRALEEILRKTTDSVRDQQWDIKDLQREVMGD